MGSARVERYYDKTAEKEWNRLARDHYHRLELEVTLHFIEKYVPRGSRILDVGGGPGRYTIALLDKGYKVALADISAGLLAKARQEIARVRRRSNLCGLYKRCATDLEGIPGKSFDAVLLLGPLYHLCGASERRKAVKEALRVLKPGGFIFSAVITRFSPVRDMLTWKPDLARKYLFEKSAELGKILSEGVYHNKSEDPRGFTDAYFARTGDIPGIYRELGVAQAEAFSCEGIAAFLDAQINGIVDNKRTWKKLLSLVIETSTEPSILGSGEHSVFVGKKRK
jgi:SAM-dependent methyltransferase